MSKSSSTPPPPSTNPSSSSQNPSQAQTQTRRALHLLALSGAILCPTIALLPPRKLDVYTLALLGGTGAAANHLVGEYTGASAAQRVQRWRVLASAATSARETESTTGGGGSLLGDALPSDRARAVRAQLAAELAAREPSSPSSSSSSPPSTSNTDHPSNPVSAAVRKVWMGDQGPDWKADRDRREKEALEAGKGYGDLIMEQIWEVWMGGKRRMEEIESVDRGVVREREAEREREEEKKRERGRGRGRE